MSLERTHPQPTRPSLPARYWLRALERLAVGELTLSLPHAQRRSVRATLPGPPANLHIAHPARLALRVLARGDIGFAEGYLAGDWDSDTLAPLLELLLHNQAHMTPSTGWPARLTHRLRHLARANTRAGSRRNVALHYDLGNDFYRLWLDPSMTYSCALFEHPSESLETAQARKYARLLDQIGARAGEHILDIGCGWGALALAAARRGLRVTGITLSRQQLALARERVAAAGLDERIELRLQDYRDVCGRFDHIVSVEMLEAVGEAYWPAFFATLARCLAPGGRVALQCITLDDAHFADYRRSPDFVQLYVFPGGMLPAPGVLRAHAERAGFRLRDAATFGRHYAETLARWDRGVQARSAEIRALGYGARFLRLWRYYLAYCIAGFRAGRIDLAQLVLER